MPWGGLITTVLSLGLAPPGHTEAVFRNPPLVANSPPSISVAFVMYLYVVNNIYRLFDPFTDGNNRLVSNFYRLFLSFTDCFCYLQTVSFVELDSLILLQTFLQTVFLVYRLFLIFTDCFIR